MSAACPACGFNQDIHDPDAYVAQGRQIAAEIRRLPSLNTPECNCRAVERGAHYHAINCAISIWMGHAIEVSS